MNTREALSTLLEYINLAHGHVEEIAERGDYDLAEAVEAVERLLEQKGCERFDPSVKDGNLTTLCDVVIDG